MHRYTIVITPDSEDGRYVVSVPALPGCFTFGATMDEAIANAKDAIEVHVSGLIKDGDPVPLEPEAAQIMTVEVA
jgi:predicted RNase H-like HicB family nuclease